MLSVPAALADSPHFLNADSSINPITGTLVVDFKEAGLGTTVTTEQVTLTADATADYQCFNNGGNHPKAGNKETVSGPLTVQGIFPVRNGQTTGTIPAGPLSQGTFACPNGQSLFLESVSYGSDSNPIKVTGVAGDFIVATLASIGPVSLHILVS
jgi:hypothetical protein